MKLYEEWIKGNECKQKKYLILFLYCKELLYLYIMITLFQEPGNRFYLGGLEMSVTCAFDTGHEGDIAGRKMRRGLSGAYAVNKLWRAYLERNK